MKKIIGIILIGTIFSSCTVSRFVYHNFADINDYKIFPYRKIKKDSLNTFRFKTTSNKEPFITLKDGSSFDKFLEDHKTVAFLVIHNDTIKYEKYFNGYQKKSIVPSFSMAKSITSILIGCAIDDNYIKSIKEPVTNYLPDLKKEGFDKVTIENLLQMTSGLKFNESYLNPFGHAAKFYYGRNLEKSSLKLKLKHEPNNKTDYVSGNTQLLGLVLIKALKGKKISQYLEEKIWKQIGMEYDATWSIDKKKNGIEKTFCCVNARAIDFAKIGRLYLNKGDWNGNRIVSKNWVDNSTKLDSLKGGDLGYQYQWWIPNKKGDFMAEGILGQFIFVSPTENLIIVRLGKKYGRVNWTDTFEKIKMKVSK